MKQFYTAVVMLFLMTFAGCGETVADVTNKELLKQLNGAHELLVVLDVRSEDEFATGHVPGAINIPHDQLALRLKELHARDNSEFVVYCETGRRANKAQRILQSDGFIKVHHLQGDMAQWRRDRLPIEQ